MGRLSKVDVHAPAACLQRRLDRQGASDKTKKHKALHSFFVGKQRDECMCYVCVCDVCMCVCARAIKSFGQWERVIEDLSFDPGFTSEASHSFTLSPKTISVPPQAFSHTARTFRHPCLSLESGGPAESVQLFSGTRLHLSSTSRGPARENTLYT